MSVIFSETTAHLRSTAKMWFSSWSTLAISVCNWRNIYPIMQFLFLLSEMSKGKLNFRTVTSSLLFCLSILLCFTISDYLCGILFKWAWRKGYYRHSKLCFLPWPSDPQRLTIKNKSDDVTVLKFNFPLLISDNKNKTKHHLYSGSWI
jgi:hypothetical protein